jgi:hypothetical protein
LDAYSKGKLIELHYDLLKEKISKIEKKNKNDKMRMTINKISYNNPFFF